MVADLHIDTDLLIVGLDYLQYVDIRRRISDDISFETIGETGGG